MSERAPVLGPGRLLIAVYGVFAISATARAGYQILSDFSEAPLAYTLSAIAAVVYIFATLALAAKTPRFKRLAWFFVGFELLGVLAVGTLSLTLPEVFARASVWSQFGAGYGFIPLILPVLGMWWLARSGTRRTEKT